MLTRTRRPHPLPSGWHMPWRNSGMKGVGQIKDSVLGSLYILCFCSPVRGVSQQSVMGRSLSSREMVPTSAFMIPQGVSNCYRHRYFHTKMNLHTHIFMCWCACVRNFLVAFVCVSFEKWILSKKANNLPYFQKVWWSAILIYHMVENSPVSLNFPLLSPVPPDEGLQWVQNSKRLSQVRTGNGVRYWKIRIYKWALWKCPTE